MQKTLRGRIYTSALGVAFMAIAMMGVGYSPQTGLLPFAIAFLILFGAPRGPNPAYSFKLLALKMPPPAHPSHKLS